MPASMPIAIIAPTVPPMIGPMGASLLPFEEPEEFPTDGKDVMGITVVNEDVDVPPFSSVITVVLTSVLDDTVGVA